MDNHQPPAPPLFASFLSSYSRSRRLEDRIRRLCEDAVTISDPTELNSTLEQLTTALQNHIERLRQVASTRPIPPERRRR
jgi:hypothetical protein